MAAIYWTLSVKSQAWNDNFESCVESARMLHREQRRKMNDPVNCGDESEPYVFSQPDFRIVAATKALLWKSARSELVAPRQLEVVARAFRVFEALPVAVGDFNIQIHLSGPRRMFGEHEIFHWWDVEIEGGNLSVTSQGHFYRPSTGGDTFTSMKWRASPGFAAEYRDYMDSIAIVDDAQPFDLEVHGIDLSQGGYSLTVFENGEEICETSDDEDECDDLDENDSGENCVTGQMTLKEVVRSLEAANVECVWADRELTALHSIDLKEQSLSDTAYRLFEHIPDLRSLDARNTDISDRTVVFIKHLKSLEWLCLRRTAVTDEGLRHLQGLISLQHLDLVGTAVRGPGLVYLRDLRSLRTLHVSGFQHRDKWLEMLRHELSECKICLNGGDAGR